MQMLFVTPRGTGGIYSQTDMLVSQINATEKQATIFISTRGSGVKTLLSAIRIIFFALHVLTKKPEIVVIELASKGSTYRKLAYAHVCKFLKIPYVIHLHGGGYADFYAASTKFMIRRIQVLFRRASGIVLLHAGQVPLIQEILGFGAGPRVTIIPNGVRTMEANPYKKPSMQEPLRLVFLGDVSEAKGVPDLLRAVASLLPGEVSLTLVGPLKLSPQNQVLLKNCEGNGTVTFVGQKSKEDALALLSQSDVLILPSKVENLPNVILEAYSLGIPVIATAVGGVPQLVAEGETGWLISVDGNLEANIVEKLKNAIVSKNTFEIISKAAFELSISKFSIDVVASRFQMFCKQVLASDSSPRETARNDQDGQK